MNVRNSACFMDGIALTVCVTKINCWSKHLFNELLAVYRKFNTCYELNYMKYCTAYLSQTFSSQDYLSNFMRLKTFQNQNCYEKKT